MELDKLFPALAGYKVLSESISGEKISNVVKVERIYRMPWYASSKKAIANLYKYHNREILSGGCVIHSIAGGWADSMCRTMKLVLQIIPNGGKIVYNEN